jgi:hypothetical protein
MDPLVSVSGTKTQATRYGYDFFPHLKNLQHIFEVLHEVFIVFQHPVIFLV